jgi:hypothetical protein
MEIAILVVVGIVVALLGLLAVFWIGVGALIILPVTVGICIVGWLIAGHTGAMAGLVLSGIIGAIVIGVSNAKS